VIEAPVELDYEGFASLLRERFAMSVGPEDSVEVDLIEVNRGPQVPGTESFSLIFRAPQGTPVEQRIYELDHPAAGRLAIFLVPIGRQPEGLLLEASFNRLKRSIEGGEA
jgi:hypothetical protein